MGNSTILGIPIHMHRKNNLHRLRDELAAAESELHEERQVMRELLEDNGFSTTCSQCGKPIYVLTRPSGDLLNYNTDGRQHWPICRQTPRPAAAPAKEESND